MSTKPILNIVMPDHLSDGQRQEWQRRQRTAENTLEIQDLSGTTPNAETIAHFQRYVRGEINLGEAIEQVRRQMAQTYDSFRTYINRRDNG